MWRLVKMQLKLSLNVSKCGCTDLISVSLDLTVNDKSREKPSRTYSAAHTVTLKTG